MSNLAATMLALDVLADAARRGDRDAYQSALLAGRDLGLTDEQVEDCYRWGRRGLGAAPDFGSDGMPHNDWSREV